MLVIIAHGSKKSQSADSSDNRSAIKVNTHMRKNYYYLAQSQDKTHFEFLVPNFGYLRAYTEYFKDNYIFILNLREFRELLYLLLSVLLLYTCMYTQVIAG